MVAIELTKLAELVQGRLTDHEHSATTPHDLDNVRISSARPLAQAVAGCVTLVDNPKYAGKLAASEAAAVITTEPLPGVSIPHILVANPHEAFAKACLAFRPAYELKRPPGIHPTASIDPSASIDPDSIIDPFVAIDADCIIGRGCHLYRGVTLMPGCQIGRDCQLYPGVVLYPGTILGDRVVIHAGSVLGAHGFGYRFSNGTHQPTSQLGWVEIENDVEIGANSAVDRGTYGATRIGQGTKIDNFVQVAHNCTIGKHNLICAHVGIAGSTSTGDYVVLAGQVGVKDHVHIGDRTQVGAQAGIASDVPPDQIMLGSPAKTRFEQAQLWAMENKLPEMRKAIKRIEAILDAQASEIHHATPQEKAG